MPNNFNFTDSGYEPTNYDLDFVATVPTFRVLAGTSKNFSSIWADPTANIKTAQMYVGTKGSGAAFSVIDMKSKVLIDSYKIDKVGRYGEALENEDTVDINVST